MGKLQAFTYYILANVECAALWQADDTPARCLRVLVFKWILRVLQISNIAMQCMDRNVNPASVKRLMRWLRGVSLEDTSTLNVIKTLIRLDRIHPRTPNLETIVPLRDGYHWVCVTAHGSAFPCRHHMRLPFRYPLAALCSQWQLLLTWSQSDLQ